MYASSAQQPSSRGNTFRSDPAPYLPASDSFDFASSPHANRNSQQRFSTSGLKRDAGSTEGAARWHRSKNSLPDQATSMRSSMSLPAYGSLATSAAWRKLIDWVCPAQTPCSVYSQLPCWMCTHPDSLSTGAGIFRSQESAKPACLPEVAGTHQRGDLGCTTGNYDPQQAQIVGGYARLEQQPRHEQTDSVRPR